MEEIIKEINCFVCQKDFAQKDKQKRGYLIAYADCFGIKEIYRLYHKKCCVGERSLGNCDICQKNFIKLIALDWVERRCHPECLERDKFARFHTHPQIKEIKVEKDKITAILEKGKESSIYFSWLIEKYQWPKNIKSEQLKNYQIDDRGFRVNFEIDEDIELDITVFMFIEGTYLGRCGCC